MAAGLGGCRARSGAARHPRLAHLASHLVVVVEPDRGAARRSRAAARAGALAGQRRRYGCAGR